MPMLMPGEAMDMADMAADMVVGIMARDLLMLSLSLMPLPTMVDTTVLDTDTVMDTVMVVTTVVDTDTGDAKGGPLNLMLMPLLMPGEDTVADTDTVVMVTVVDMATTDKCHLSSQI